MKKAFLEAGKIVNTHGIRGEVKIQPWADSPEFLTGFKTFYIDEVPVSVVRSRVHKSMVIAQLKGIDDVDSAMRLKNKLIWIARADASLPQGDFFIQDIQGARVVDEVGQELGILKEVLELPSHNVYVVSGDREILIPAVPEFVLNTDVENGVITVRLLKGM
jgi:16S rRNA processing protein RimM